ncbi:hypothetical protein HPG69_006554 [Diceros bicornis minor]|uniref:MGAT4 conserved region domain-containing protein n=1 Tax=Diceros bicornis minor TaxID=77932 RepID=A0A7J7F5S0_DICBM|nr:hypothetical protein HPG69_006554 [Diceros bicornis minor]
MGILKWTPGPSPSSSFPLSEDEEINLNVEKKVNTSDKNETVSNTFEVLKFFFPHLKRVGRIYPDVIIGKEKTGGSWEDQLAYNLSLPESNEDYLKSVVDMITKNWQIKQVLDICFLMLYAQPKAMYYLQLEDDIIAKKMYFTKITDFLHNITSNNWFYVEFSILGFIGKLFKSEDLIDFVRFFLMFYKDKPIDLLLGDIFQEKCIERNKQIRIRYKSSLFQHAGIQSSLHGKEQYFKDIYY